MWSPTKLLEKPNCHWRQLQDPCKCVHFALREPAPVQGEQGRQEGSLGIRPGAQVATTFLSCRTPGRAPFPAAAAAPGHGQPSAPAQPPLCSRLQPVLSCRTQSGQVRRTRHHRPRSEPGTLAPPQMVLGVKTLPTL